MAQQVDRFTGLAQGLGRHAAVHQTSDGQVLPDQHAQLVGRVVQLGPGDVSHRPHQIEAGVPGGPDVVGHLRGRGRAQQRAGGQQVGTLGEQPLAVDVQHPPAHRHRPEPDAEVPAVVHLRAGHGFHLQVAQLLITERVGPPQRGIVYLDGPLQAVLAGGGMVDVDVLGAGHPGAQVDRTAAGHVQHRPQLQLCLRPAAARFPAAGLDTGAHRPPVADGDPSARPQPHRAPHPAHDQVLDPAQLGILQPAGEQGAIVRVAEPAAGGLDGQHVLGAGRQLLGHLQFVGHEVPVGVAQVGAVEPHVPLLGQPLEPQPPPRAVCGGAGLSGRLRRPVEAVAVKHRLLQGQAGRLVAGRALRPMAGHRHRRPPRVVVVDLVERAPPSLGSRRDPPHPTQVHRPKLPPTPPPVP